MKEKKEKNFFDEIRRAVKTSYFVSSIFPLAILVGIFFIFVAPRVDQQTRFYLQIILVITVILSVLGLLFSSKATKASILSAQNLQEKLNSLIEVTKQFRETLYLDILLESIVKSAMHLNSAESGSLLLYDEKGDLRFKVLVGERSQTIKDRAVKRGEGITGWVADKGEPAIINDVTGDKRFNASFDEESGYRTKSIMCVPLVHNREVIGVIEVLNKRIGTFNQEDEKLLFSLADQASISIAQSRVFESRHSDLIHITEILIGVQDFHIPQKMGHARRVANYANLIAKNMGLSEKDSKNLYYAALFHDIGLLKISMTDQKEKEHFIKHPQIGYEMINPVSIWREASDFILGHHERYDGTGYPLAKKSEEIPLGARILSVANTFDIITSNYSYKQKIDYHTAIKEIEANSGTQFDPDVVKAFKAAIKDSDLISD